MNERTFKWELTQGLVLELVSLNKEERRDFFKNLPIENVPMGSLMDTSSIEVDDKGLKIEFDESNKIYGYIKKINLSKDKNEQKTERFAAGENVDSVLISIDSKTRMLNLSIKELEIQDEKEVLNKYGSSSSGASLGDILGSVLKK